MEALKSLQPAILMRSIFFVKKTRAAMEKVKSLKADVIVLDMEDSVEPNERVFMRELYICALKDKVFGSSTIFVRTSGLATMEDVQRDITTFVGSGIEGLMIPKISTANDIFHIEQQIAAVENEKNLPPMQTKLLPIIETLPSYFALDKIALASKRNIGLIGGSGDFTADALCEDHSETYNNYFSKIVLAAKSASILPLWGVHDRIDDHAGYYRVNEQMKRNGFAGTAALTPKQIAMANTIYSLSPKELEWSQSVRMNDSCIKLVQPSVQESRQMIGPPHRVKAENMLKQYISLYQRKRNPAITRSANGLSPEVKIGEIVATPSECLITDGMISIWEAAFLQYSSNVGVDTRIASPSLKCVPFSLSATLAAAFSVQRFSYYARAHLGFSNIFQARALVPGDRLRAIFRIDDVLLKKFGDNNSYAVANSKHWLVNQEEKVVLQLSKTTMFHPSHCSPKSAATKSTKSLNPESSPLFEYLMSSNMLASLSFKATPTLTPGEIMVHDTVKVMGHSEVRMLCNLLKIINPHHHNIVRYNSTDILVPGPFVMAAALSNASIDIGEVVYEDISSCINPNKVNLGDQVGTLTFVQKCTTLESNPCLEEVILKHFALKNIDMDVVASLTIPQELFSEDKKPSEYERLCIEKMPLLIHKIVCVTTRRIVRVCSGLKKPNLIPPELA